MRRTMWGRVGAVVGLLLLLVWGAGFGLAQEATGPAGPVPDAAEANPIMVLTGALLALSEALALIPSLKANGILHAVLLVLRRVTGKGAVPVVLLLLAANLMACTTVQDLGGGRYIVPRAVEVRSLFGTNMGFAKLETCDGVERTDGGLRPLFPTRDYVNCQGVTDWSPMSSQGQGGQLVQGALIGAGIGVGGALSGSTVTLSQSQTLVAPAVKSHH